MFSQGWRLMLALLLLRLMLPGNAICATNEVLVVSPTQVVMRQHPKTGKAFVSIVSAEAPEAGNLLAASGGTLLRPDYSLLDPNVKASDVPYEGPYSDRRKIYVFGVTLATIGVTGGVAGMALAPTAGTAVGGGGAYLAAGGALMTGAVSTAVIKTKPRVGEDDFKHTSESVVLETEEKAAENSMPLELGDAD